MPQTTAPKAAPKNRTHWLYLAVIVAVGLGILVGLLFPDFAVKLKPLGEGFVALITMMIQPVIFCTIILGVGSVASAAKVGKVGALALCYFLIMSTFALTIGLVVGNLIHPGSGLDLNDEVSAAGAAGVDTAGGAGAAVAPPAGDSSANSGASRAARAIPSMRFLMNIFFLPETECWVASTPGKARYTGD